MAPPVLSSIAATPGAGSVALTWNTNVAAETHAAMWLKPKKGCTWDWQIGNAGTINTSGGAQVYDIDGFDHTTSEVTALHAANKLVIAYFSAGTAENWRDDYDDFPSGIQGPELDDWPNEFWLDVRALSTLEPLMAARAALAASKGFDGIEWDNIDGFDQEEDIGFPLTGAHQLAYNQMLARITHQYGLFVLLKNDAGQQAALQPYFDGVISEEAQRYTDSYSAFTTNNKPWLDCEYRDVDMVCSTYNALGASQIRCTLALSAPPTVQCVTSPPAQIDLDKSSPIHDTSLVTTHAKTFTGLTEGQSYGFMVWSKNTDGSTYSSLMYAEPGEGGGGGAYTDARTGNIIASGSGSESHTGGGGATYSDARTGVIIASGTGTETFDDGTPPSFPVVESVRPTASNQTGGAATNGDTNLASHNVVLPATVSAGSLLLIVGRTTAAGSPVTVPAGWTVVQVDSDSSPQILFYAYKNTLAAGTEDGTNVAIGHPTGRLVAVSMSITDAADPAVQPPEVALQGGLGTTIVPGIMVPTGGAKDYLWLVIGSWRGTQNSGNSPPATTWPPTNYTSVRGASTGTTDGSANNAQIVVGRRSLNASSEDPPSFTTATVTPARENMVWTMALHPPVSAPVSPPVNATAPAVTGTAVTTHTLSCSTGAWTNPPITSYAYQWKRNGVSISGATSSSYTLVSADEGQSIRCMVTATNAVGSASANSNIVTPAPNVAPANTAVPVITGTPAIGVVLFCSTGTWANSPTSFAWQWKRNGVNISGATGDSYTVTEPDIGQSITCAVTATNVVGSASASSGTVTPVGVAPTLTTSPAITGSAVLGNTVLCSSGTWTSLPTSYAYQWKRNGTNISGATGNSRVLAAADVGQSIKCTVTAINAWGSASADSNTITPFAPPANTVLPVITGTAEVGNLLSCSQGTWTGFPTPTYVYQWKRDGSNISGAASNTYVLGASDAGALISCTVFGVNGLGSIAANAVAVGPISGEGFVSPPPPTDIISSPGGIFTAGRIQPVANWQFILCETPRPTNPTGELVEIGELESARNRNVDIIRNRGGTASCQISIHDEFVPLILDRVPNGDIRGTLRKSLLVRRNKVDMWGGPIMSIQGSLGEGGGFLELGAVGWMEYLFHRELAAAKHYTDETGPFIAFDLLHIADMQETAYPLPIFPGKAYGQNVLNTRFSPTFAKGDTIGASIQKLSDVENGFDFEVDPRTRELNIYAWDSYAVRDNIRLGYRWGPENIAKLDWAEAGSNTRNRITAITSTNIPYTGQDEEAIDEYGLFQETVNLPVETSDIVRPFINAELVVKSRPQVTYTVTPKPVGLIDDGAPRLFDDYFIGDQVSFTAQEGYVVIRNQGIRIFGASITISDDGVETINNLQTTPAT